MGISLRIGREARQHINHAIRTAGVSVVEALLVDAIRHLLPAEETPDKTATDSAQSNTSTATHEGATQ